MKSAENGPHLNMPMAVSPTTATTTAFECNQVNINHLKLLSCRIDVIINTRCLYIVAENDIS